MLILALAIILPLLTGCGRQKEEPKETNPPRPAIAVSREEARAALDAYDANLLFLQEPENQAVLQQANPMPGKTGGLAEVCYRFYLAGELPSSEIVGLGVSPRSDSENYLILRLEDGSELWFLFNSDGSVGLVLLGGVGENSVVLYGNDWSSSYWNTEYDGVPEYPIF